MTRKLVLGGALLFVLACSSVLNAAGHPGADSRLDRSWKRYRNSNLGYCVSYPGRWHREAAFEGAGLVVDTGTARYSKPIGEIDIGPLLLSSSADARMSPASLSQDLEEHLNGLRKFARAERLEVLGQREMSFQGSAALFTKHRYYDPLERATWMEEVVFVKRAGELYRLELQCQADQLERFEPVFAYLLNTFQFDCK